MEIQVFEKEGFGQISITDNNGEPWFVAKDIAEILGYSETSAMTRTLDEDEVSNVRSADSAGRDNHLLIISESGLYSAILRSRRSEAKAFKKWVTSEVLPSIRKTGSYTAKSALPEVKEASERINAATNIFDGLKSVAMSLGCDNNTAAISANQACNLVTGVNLMQILGKTHLIAEKQDIPMTPTQIGKEIGMSAVTVNKKLDELGFQTKISEYWVPTEKGKEFAKVLDTGKKHNSGTPITQVKWFSGIIPFLK